MIKLKELRGEKTQAYIAEKLNIPRETYRSYEAGLRQPDPEMLKKMADFFDVTVDYLLGRNVPRQVPAIPPELQDDRFAFSDGLSKDLTEKELEEMKRFREFLITTRKSNT